MMGNNIIGRLAFNAHVQVVSRIPGGWLHVSTRDGRKGYVATEHIWSSPEHPLPGRRILYKYGESPSVVDARTWVD
ncbi:SH3 domain-containing protein [Corallococcus sp. NCSPR001]|nr:SH3 domain-containing protein [Corallococcus sp. NCSPR001]